MVSLPPFEQVVADHGEVVWRVCRAVVAHHDAEEAWSETFAAALAAYPRLRPDSNLRGWLVTIAHHKAIDQTRAANRVPVPLDPLPEWPARRSDRPDPDDDLWAAMTNLTSKQRAAVAYHHIAGMPYAEVAAVLDTTEAAARRAAADGIASLRRALTQES